MTRRRHAWRLATFLATPLLIVLTSCDRPKYKETLPPLLRHLEAHGGWGDACPVPPKLKVEVAREGLADAPELDRRLKAEFPPGTAEIELVTNLQKIGFRPTGSCKDDGTIHIARYDQPPQPDVFLFFTMTATIYWKIDENDKVVWSKGFVVYNAL